MLGDEDLEKKWKWWWANWDLIKYDSIMQDGYCYQNKILKTLEHIQYLHPKMIR